MRKSILVAVLAMLAVCLAFGDTGVTPLQWAEHYDVRNRQSAITDEELNYIDFIPSFGSSTITKLLLNTPITSEDQLRAIPGIGEVKARMLLALYDLDGAEGPIATEPTEPTPSFLTMLTWNVRGYPETQSDRQQWFSQQLERIDPDLICVQEIANDARVSIFLQEEGFTKVAFLNSSDGQDNAIFAKESVSILDIADPEGFQHPAQAAYVRSGGLDAMVVSVHLSWSNVSLREAEKSLVGEAADDLRRFDPDVIICGDFNTKQPGMGVLAQDIGMVVMPTPGQESQGTTHAGNRYDYFLISPDVDDEEARECWIEVFEGEDLLLAQAVSDHLPVVCEFKTDEEFSDWK